MTARHPARDGAAVAIAWVLILGIVTGIGELIVHASSHNILGDEAIPHWLAARRTPSRTHWSVLFSTLGATQAVLIVSVAAAVIALAVLRRWRPVVFIVVVMVGELVMFLAASTVVHRPRPDVPNLDPHLPTFAYPSGHVAATVCIYVAITVLVFGHTRAWWRWLFLIPAIVMPVLVITSRVYRGEHHPTDVLGSLVFVALWIPVATWLIKPTVDRGEARVPATAELPEVS
jgi:undecaprenyl-diphosphatase